MIERRLARILKIKRVSEEQAEIETRRIKDELDAERKKLHTLRVRLEDIIAGINNTGNGQEVDIRAMNFQYNRLFDLAKEIQEQLKTLDVKTREYEKKKDELIEIHKEKRILEILLERVFRERLREGFRKEQKEIDFNSITRGFREL